MKKKIVAKLIDILLNFARHILRSMTEGMIKFSFKYFNYFFFVSSECQWNSNPWGQIVSRIFW